MVLRLIILGLTGVLSFPVAARPGLISSRQIADGNDHPQRIVHAANAVYVAGQRIDRTADSYQETALLMCLDPEGYPKWNLSLPAVEVSAAALDGAENLWAAGTTSSVEFPVTPDAFQSGIPGGQSFYSRAAFLVKINSAGQILYATYFGPAGTSVRDLAIAPNGDIVVTGSTYSPEFPTTPDAVMPSIPYQSGFGSSLYAFVTGFRPDGRTLVFSTYLGGRRADCRCGGSCCVGVVGHSIGLAVTLDSENNVYVAGSTTATDFPTTQQFIDEFPDYWKSRQFEFAAKLNPSGTNLLYSVSTGVAPAPGAIAVDRDGSLIVAGSTRSTVFKVSPNAIQPKHLGCEIDYLCDTPNGFVYRLAPSGDRFESASYLGGSSSEIQGFAVGADGSAWLSGTGAGADFPVIGPGLPRGSDFVIHLNAETTDIVETTVLPAGLAGGGLAVASEGRLVLAGETGLVSQLTFNAPETPHILGVASAAGGLAEGIVSPGEIVSLYGFDIGPDAPTGLEFDRDGRVGTVLKGVRVFFQGLSAPLIYAQHDQINAVVPFGVAGMPEIRIQLMQSGTVVAERDVRVAQAHPRFFARSPGENAAAAINEDGTLNGPDNPAAPGSIVAIYGAGFGDLSPRPVDGELVEAPLPELLEPVSATGPLNGPLDVLYAGPAPTLVAGATQVNVRLPEERYWYGTIQIGFAGHIIEISVW